MCAPDTHVGDSPTLDSAASRSKWPARRDSEIPLAARRSQKSPARLEAAKRESIFSPSAHFYLVIIRLFLFLDLFLLQQQSCATAHLHPHSSALLVRLPTDEKSSTFGPILLPVPLSSRRLGVSPSRQHPPIARGETKSLANHQISGQAGHFLPISLGHSRPETAKSARNT